MAYVHYHGAAAAAAEQQRLLREEEEEMTPYTPADLADYEFKILRSATNAFKLPAKLQEVLQEEAQAGWVLVEKFDNSRLRLKRPTNAKQRDGNLNFDPYRTNIGPSQNTIALIIVVSIFGILALVIFATIMAKV